MSSIRESILEFKGHDLIEIDASEHLGEGATLYKRPLPGDGFSRWVDAKVAGNGLDVAILIQQCICDQDGKLLFTESDIERIAKKPASLILFLGDAVAANEPSIRGGSELEGNSETDQTDNSGSS